MDLFDFTSFFRVDFFKFSGLYFMLRTASGRSIAIRVLWRIRRPNALFLWRTSRWEPMRRGWGRDIRGWSRTSWRWRLACCRWRGTTSCRIGRRGNSSLRGWPQLCKLRIKLVKSKYSYKSFKKLVKLILHTCRSVCSRRFRGHFCVSRLLLRPSVRLFIWKNIIM